MPSIHQFYGNRWMWDPDQYPDQKVVFDGLNKLIYVNEGVTELDVKIDIYSAWKEWVLNSPEYPYTATWKEAISVIGGEPLNDTLNVGSTFFLENGWRIQPYSSSTPYTLSINGNIFTREAGENPALFAEGASVTFTRSSLVTTITPSLAFSQTDIDAVAAAVWSELIGSPVPGSYGEAVNGLDSDLSINTQTIQLLDSDLTIIKQGVADALTEKRFLALK